MGKIIRYQCTRCSFHKDLFVGAGLRDCELPVIAASLPINGQQRLEYYIQHGASRVSINRAASICGACRSIITLPVVRFSVNGETRELRGICPDCGEPGTSAIVAPSSVPCPHCGTVMQGQSAGHWD